ncbi:hypothetical protein IXEL_3 [Microbacterium phage Ixel]|nr:hypothetical protein IXEL_3 [Microbacterium phage Ixel]
MSVTLYDKTGQAVAGDDRIGQPMKDLCNELGGTIKDDQTGETLYPKEG